MKLFPVTCEYIKGEKQFYYRAQQFYEDVPASEEGMMGDFVEISNIDLEGSQQFLKRFVVSPPEKHIQVQYRSKARSDLIPDQWYISLQGWSYLWMYMSGSILDEEFIVLTV